MTVLGALLIVTVIWELTWANVKIKTRKWNAQRCRMAKRTEIQTHVSCRVSWCCSSALSHFPSQNYFITEKIYKQKNSYFITNGRSIRAEKRRIQEQASWRVSSEVISIRLPSVTFHLEIVLRWKKFLQAENLAVFYYQRQSHDCEDHVVWLISICYWRYNVIFDTPRSPPAEKSFSLLLEIFNFAMLFFFLPNFD